MFDVRSYLDEVGVNYYTSGKNVTHGWTGIACPACEDRSSHGGIAPNGEFYSCFKCGHKSHVTGLIRLLEDCSWSKAKEIYQSFSDSLFLPDYAAKREHAAKVEWPPIGVKAHLPKLHTEYLKSRGYDPKQLEELFKIKGVYQVGDFKYRIIIPVYHNGKLVSYLGRDVTGQQKLKYKNLSISKSVVSIKDCVYNIDSVHNKAIICEGVFDAWRFGHAAVAMFGLLYTQRQVQILSRKLKEAIICFDNEKVAQEQADKLAEELSYAGVKVSILHIDTKDPGEMSQKEANEIRQYLFG